MFLFLSILWVCDSLQIETESAADEHFQNTNVFMRIELQWRTYVTWACDCFMIWVCKKMFQTNLACEIE